MFLRKTERRKNGKTHLYWSVVENRRLDNGRVAQRHVLYLGEINSSQAEVWRRAIEVFDEDVQRMWPRQQPDECDLPLLRCNSSEGVLPDRLIKSGRLLRPPLQQTQLMGSVALGLFQFSVPLLLTPLSATVIRSQP